MYIHYVQKYTHTHTYVSTNNTICNKKQLRKCQITNPFSDQNLRDTNRTTPIQFQNISSKIMYVITRNINITITRPVSIFLCFRAVFFNHLLDSWRINNPVRQFCANTSCKIKCRVAAGNGKHLCRPTVSNKFASRLLGAGAPRSINAKNRTGRQTEPF